MPKIKTHSASKKRYSLNKNGLVKHGKMGKRHNLTKTNTKRKRNLRKGAYVDKTCTAAIKKLLPYA